jgi:hypothetical protein
MYVGHFAIAAAIKARKPEVPALPLFFGAGFIDILNGIFIVAGIDRVTANPAAGPYLFFDLTFVDWDHSLAAAVIWSVVWGALFFKQGRGVALWGALAAFSHFIADWPMHNGDLALYPHATEHLGLGLWSRLGVGSWLLEGAFAAALCAYAWEANARRGVSSLWPTVFLAALFLSLSPWLSPMKQAATLTEPAAHLVHGVLVTVGFLAPGAILTWLVSRAERAAKGMRASSPTSSG